MKDMDVLIYKSLIVLVVGAVLMLVLSFTVYRKSYYYKKAQAEMLGVKQKPGTKSRMVTVMIMFAMILILAIADLWISSGKSYSFGFMFGFNLLLIAILSLYDALFIDVFILLVWRPAILRLPEGQPTRDLMIRHIKMQFTLGWLFKFPIAFLSAGLWKYLSSWF
jgi:hypothetical protein